MTARWGMVIDLNRCVGCQTCVAACKHENATPPGVQWRRVLDIELGAFPDVQRLFMVTGCQHCEEPPCVPVCPTGATRRRADGLVTMDYDRCIGCAACVVACPYQARDLAGAPASDYGGAPTPPERVRAHDERIGVATKCTFCVERLDAGLDAGLTPGIDAAATPACAASCIASAIHFGDFADEDGNLAALLRDNQSFRMHEQLGTEPRIRYLYETPTTPGRDADIGAAAAATEPLAGRQQPYWDWKGAMNFVCGGLGSGFAVVAALFALGAGDPWFPFALAALVMAVGLVALLFKIGRPRRALYAALRPGSSWMARELWAAAAFFPLVLLGLVAPAPWLHAGIGIAAALFLLCQARILHACRGIPAWRAPHVPWLLALSGLLEGAGLYAIAGLAAPGLAAGADMAPPVGAILAGAAAVLWHRYRRAAAAGAAGPAAGAALAAITPWLHGIGHALPLALFAAALAAPDAAAPVLAALGGLAAIAGGAGWKFWVVLRAGHQQGFAVPRVPRRGSGAYAAPPRLELA